MLTLLASGIAMMAMSWGHQPWIVVAFIGIVAMGVALMTAKPTGYGTSLLVLGAAALGGIVASLPLAGHPAPIQARRPA